MTSDCGAVQNECTAEPEGHGLRRQHRMTKVATGWIPTDSGPEHEHRDYSDGLSESEIASIVHQTTLTVPLNAQQVVDKELKKWSKEWDIENGYSCYV